MLSQEIWRFTRDERKEAITYLLEIIINTFQYDPEIFTRASNQLEPDIGMAGVSRLITIGSAEKEQKVLFQR